MTLKQMAENAWLRTHTTSTKEIAALLGIVERDLNDSQKDVSADCKFGVAYNAALKLCIILLYASGYRPAKGQSSHIRPIESVPIILGDSYSDDSDYLDGCRNKRNESDYDAAGGVTEDDAKELIEFTKEFREVVLSWLQKHHANLVPKKS